MRMEYVVVSYPTVRDVRMEETEETGRNWGRFHIKHRPRMPEDLS